MFSPQAAMIKPFLAARADYGQIWHFWPKMTIFWFKNWWRIWRILGLIYGGSDGEGGVKGSNRLFRMWHTIFTHLQPCSTNLGQLGLWMALKQVFFETPCRIVCCPWLNGPFKVFWFNSVIDITKVSNGGRVFFQVTNLNISRKSS